MNELTNGWTDDWRRAFGSGWLTAWWNWLMKTGGVTGLRSLALILWSWTPNPMGRTEAWDIEEPDERLKLLSWTLNDYGMLMLFFLTDDVFLALPLCFFLMLCGCCLLVVDFGSQSRFLLERRPPFLHSSRLWAFRSDLCFWEFFDRDIWRLNLGEGYFSQGFLGSNVGIRFLTKFILLTHCLLVHFSSRGNDQWPAK